MCICSMEHFRCVACRYVYATPLFRLERNVLKTGKCLSRFANSFAASRILSSRVLWYGIDSPYVQAESHRKRNA